MCRNCLAVLMNNKVLSQLLLEAYWPNKLYLSSSYPASNCHAASVCRTGLLSKWRAEPGRLGVQGCTAGLYSSPTTTMLPQPVRNTWIQSQHTGHATPSPVQQNVPLGGATGQYAVQPGQILPQAVPHDNSSPWRPQQTVYTCVDWGLWWSVLHLCTP